MQKKLFRIECLPVNCMVCWYFCTFKNHIGFYATPTGHAIFKKELSNYKEGKGSVQFLIDQPLPLTLVTKIVKYRVKENLEKMKKK